MFCPQLDLWLQNQQYITLIGIHADFAFAQCLHFGYISDSTRISLRIWKEVLLSVENRLILLCTSVTCSDCTEEKDWKKHSHTWISTLYLDSSFLALTLQSNQESPSFKISSASAESASLKINLMRKLYLIIMADIYIYKLRVRRKKRTVKFVNLLNLNHKSFIFPLEYAAFYHLQISIFLALFQNLSASKLGL